MSAATGAEPCRVDMSTPATRSAADAVALLLKMHKEILAALSGAGEVEALRQVVESAEAAIRPFYKGGRRISKFEQETLVEALTQIDAANKARKLAEQTLADHKASQGQAATEIPAKLAAGDSL